MSADSTDYNLPPPDDAHNIQPHVHSHLSCSQWIWTRTHEWTNYNEKLLSHWNLLENAKFGFVQHQPQNLLYFTKYFLIILISCRKLVGLSKNNAINSSIDDMCVLANILPMGANRFETCSGPFCVKLNVKCAIIWKHRFSFNNDSQKLLHLSDYCLSTDLWAKSVLLEPKVVWQKREKKLEIIPVEIGNICIK